jgi:hypothetical protein
MSETSPIYAPGDHVLALRTRGRERYWLPGVVTSVGARGARVDFAPAAPARVPFSRLRLGEAR